MKILVLILIATCAYAGVLVVTEKTLGYSIAQEIIKKAPHEDLTYYDLKCVSKAKEKIKMGLNLKIWLVRSSCMSYIKNRNKRKPTSPNSSYLLDSLRN